MKSPNTNTFEEVELRLVDLFCDTEKVSVDIGTSGRGPYTEQMIPHSKDVFAYEPHPRSAQKMRDRYGETITLREYAVSDAVGTATLAVPMREDSVTERTGWSSIEKDFSQNETGFAKYTVKTTTIDEEKLPSVSLIKIDVEGAEIEALKGGSNTIRKYRPFVILDMDELHRKGTLQTNTAFFEQLNYSGYYIENGKPGSIVKFIASGRTNNLEIGGDNIYNFIFIPNERADIQEAITERLSESETEL